MRERETRDLNQGLRPEDAGKISTGGGTRQTQSTAVCAGKHTWFQIGCPESRRLGFLKQLCFLPSLCSEV